MLFHRGVYLFEELVVEIRNIGKTEQDFHAEHQDKGFDLSKRMVWETSEMNGWIQ